MMINPANARNAAGANMRMETCLPGLLLTRRNFCEMLLNWPSIDHLKTLQKDVNL